MREIALRVWEVWNGEVVMNRRPTVATIDAAMAKNRTPASASRAWASCASIPLDRKSTRLNSSHSQISYAVFCLKKKNHKPSYHTDVSPRPDCCAPPHCHGPQRPGCITRLVRYKSPSRQPHPCPPTDTTSAPREC